MGRALLWRCCAGSVARAGSSAIPTTIPSTGGTAIRALMVLPAAALRNHFDVADVKGLACVRLGSGLRHSCRSAAFPCTFYFYFVANVRGDILSRQGNFFALLGLQFVLSIRGFNATLQGLFVITGICVRGSSLLLRGVRRLSGLLAHVRSLLAHTGAGLLLRVAHRPR